MGAFSGRPLIVLELFFTAISHNEGANQSSFSWQLRARETSSQPSFGLDMTRTSSVTLSVEGGIGVASTTYTFGSNIAWNYDFSPSGLQTRVIGTGSFTLNHRSDGYGGVVTINAAANDPTGNLGSATASAQAGPLPDYNRSPSWASISTPSPVIRGQGYYGFFSANAAGSYGIISGRLPNGLSFNTGNGEITGTPTETGSFDITVRAYGVFEGSTDANRVIVVNPPAPVFSDASVSSTARIGDPYVDGVQASDATSYSINSGSLPSGLSLNDNTGAITGTPNTTGTFNFTVRAFNVTGSVATGTQTITVFSSAGVWNGSTFVSGRVRVWNGSSWKDTNDVRVWNGSSWVQAK